MSEFNNNTGRQMRFGEADYYLFNGYYDRYFNNLIEINHNDFVRMYVVNIGTLDRTLFIFILL